MKSQKFLQFNGKTLYFLNKDGNFYIAYKPIVDALGIDANRVYKNLKKHKIYGPALAILPMQVENNGVIQIRNMTCIPEKHIYFWIATLNSDNEELLLFQQECHEILFNYFRGTITGRKELLTQKIELDIELMQAENELLQNEAYLKIQKIKKKQSEINRGLKNNDLKVIEEQKNLFNYQ